MIAGKSITSFCRRNPVISYCILVFSISWGLKYLYSVIRSGGVLPYLNFSLIAQFGPSIAAVILISVTDGTEGLLKLARNIVNWRESGWWLILAASFEFVMFGFITVMYFLKYGAFQDTGGISFITAVLMLLSTFFIGLFRWGLAEEIGWRGWMFPKLQVKYSAFTASVIGAVIITLWHINPFYIAEHFIVQESPYIIGYFPDTVERLIISIPIVLVMTYIYNNTKGSLLPMIFFHSASNTSYFWIKDVFGITGTDFFRTYFFFILIIIFVVFTILVLKQRKKAIY